MNKVKIGLIIVSCVVSYIIGDKMGKKVVKETEIVEVEKVVIQENVRTIIKERPDGTKTTIIEQVKTTNKGKVRSLKSKEKPVEKTWSIWAATGSRLDAKLKPTYTLGVDHKLILGLSVGLYGRTDSEFGLSLRYEF